MTKLTGDIAIRHRTRRVEMEVGVTPEMVVEVVQLLYEKYRQPDFPDWPEFLDDARKHRSLWRQYFDFEPSEDFSEFGENAWKIRAVVAVADVIFAPPDPELV